MITGMAYAHKPSISIDNSQAPYLNRAKDGKDGANGQNGENGAPGQHGSHGGKVGTGKNGGNGSQAKFRKYNYSKLFIIVKSTVKQGLVFQI